ncbi:putative oxidoreductase ucpA [Byssothecium circinans]|uniref:Putative oxidoreductase ucpA n=1 Tax=Byssothecium circinans TaxID=147558 RepID=A0A6A5TES7_9PLEO|nr:putative oxidoreductase ucpA [Byssothecium circinans]
MDQGETVEITLITGAGRGIGHAIALQYAQARSAGIIIVARSGDRLDEVESAIKNISGGTKALKSTTDVTSIDAVTQLAKKVETEFGRLDVPINNAGSAQLWAKLHETDPLSWWNTFEVNVKAPYLLLRSLLPLLASTAEKYNTTSTVINTSSLAANMVAPGASAYSTRKTALDMLTEFVMQEYGDRGVVCVSVQPGAVPTVFSLAEPAVRHLLTDTPELCGGWCVWMTSQPRQWLSGRAVSATWDVGRLEELREDIVNGDKLKKRLVI